MRWILYGTTIPGTTTNEVVSIYIIPSCSMDSRTY